MAGTQDAGTAMVSMSINLTAQNLAVTEYISSKRPRYNQMDSKEKELIEVDAFQQRVFGIKSIFKCIKCGKIMEDFHEVPDHIVACNFQRGDLLKKKSGEGKQ
jgi:hypothetical protein